MVTPRAETIRGEVGDERTTMPVFRNRASWGAIWAGLFATLGIEALFTALMVGIFAGLVNPSGSPPSGRSFAIGIAVWFFVQTVAAFYVGGWAAGRLANRSDRVTNALHAFAVWGFGTLIMLYTLVSAGGPAVTATFNLLRLGLGVVTAGAQAIGTPGGAPPIGGANLQLVAATALSVATWISIYLFITFALSWVAALAGGAAGAEREKLPA